ncbi:MAG: Septum formation initiator [Anaerocolumna sp.]|jgi:cell division protein DivIC|nr:Septum formation initiator [Anaerocolumna sp.]
MKGKGKRRRQRTGLRLTAIMVLIICGVVTLKTQELDLASAKTTARIEELEKVIGKETEKSAEIKEQKAYMQTLKFIEDMAREKFGLVYKDEIIFEADN